MSLLLDDDNVADEGEIIQNTFHGAIYECASQCNIVPRNGNQCDTESGHMEVGKNVDEIREAGEK